MKPLCFTFIICFTLALFGQEKRITIFDDICACLETKYNNSGSINYLNNLVDSCISASLLTNLTFVLKEYSVDFNNDKSMHSFAQKISGYLNKNCNVFFRINRELALLKVEEQKAKWKYSEGILIKIDFKNQIPIISIADSTGLQYDFLWVEEFDGSSRFMYGQSEHLNSWFRVYWEFQEVYDSSKKNYEYKRKVKMIDKISEVELVKRKRILELLKK